MKIKKKYQMIGPIETMDGCENQQRVWERKHRNTVAKGI